MNQSDIVLRLADLHPKYPAKDVAFAVEVIIGAIANTLSRGERVEVRGFGSFQLNYRAPRQGRNPMTGEKVQVPAKFVPHFKPGKEFRERVDRKTK